MKTLLNMLSSVYKSLEKAMMRKVNATSTHKIDAVSRMFQLSLAKYLPRRKCMSTPINQQKVHSSAAADVQRATVTTAVRDTKLGW